MSPICIIERQTEGGSWIKVCDGSSHPVNIKRLLDSAVKAYPQNKKFRAIDSVSKQLLDMAFS
jgi:hypothetical protein